MWIAQIAVAALVGFLGWAYVALIMPPPPKVCVPLNGPPVTSPRIKLRDGRYLAYKERGSDKENAKCKIIIVYGFDSSKDENLPISQDIIEKFQIYLLSFDRAGYGESDPNPKRSVKNDALDIGELANKLQLGTKFYVAGLSMGAYPVWGCLYYIPHRFASIHFRARSQNGFFLHTLNQNEDEMTRNREEESDEEQRRRKTKKKRDDER